MRSPSPKPQRLVLATLICVSFPAAECDGLFQKSPACLNRDKVNEGQTCSHLDRSIKEPRPPGQHGGGKTLPDRRDGLGGRLQGPGSPKVLPAPRTLGAGISLPQTHGPSGTGISLSAHRNGDASPSRCGEGLHRCQRRARVWVCTHWPITEVPVPREPKAPAIYEKAIFS